MTLIDPLHDKKDTKEADNNNEPITLLESLSDEPNNIDLLNSLGIYYSENNLFDKSIKIFQQALRIDNQNSTLLYNLANTYKKGVQYKKALSLYKRAVSFDNQLYQAYFQLGNIYLENNHFHEATFYFKKAIDIKQDYKEALCNLGVCYYRMCLLSDAISQYNRVLEIDPDYPDAHYNLALALFMSGDYKSGFVEYEWRFKTRLLKPFNPKRPIWLGQISEGLRLHVACEQGFGDMIQFIRFINKLNEKNLKVAVQCPIGLSSLFENSFKTATFLQEEPDDYDFFIPLMSIPRLLNISLDNIPNEMPYLYPKTYIIEKWAKKIDVSDDLLKVGICWRGSKENKRGNYRSIPDNLIIPLLQTKDIVSYNLMKDKIDDTCFDTSNFIDLSEGFYDFEQTAGLIANLDLIITIDTVIAHLAGAMGKPVFLILHYSSDWRWMLNTTVSPWYPTIKIFRQSEPNNWKDVLELVKSQLLIEKSQLRTHKKSFQYNISYASEDFSKDNFQVSLLNKCRQFIALKRYDDAIACLKDVITIKPDFVEAYWELSLLLLRDKNFLEGWKYYEWRKKLPETINYYNYPKILEWDGKIIKGKRILVYDEQGFGDAIQFIRFLRPLTDGGMVVTIICRDELARLFKQFSGLNDVIPRSKPYGEYDCVVSMMSLPYLLGVGFDDLFIKTPYFHIPQSDTIKWRAILKDGMNIGFVLSSRKSNIKDMVIREFMPILDVQGIHFFNLDKSREYTIDSVTNVSGDFTDFYDTASFIECLDLVITVDTAVAHVAGALNREVWLMLPFHSDWRWFEGDDTTVWYPTMRIFKQKESLNWKSVINEIRQKLLERFA